MGGEAMTPSTISIISLILTNIFIVGLVLILPEPWCWGAILVLLFGLVALCDQADAER